MTLAMNNNSSLPPPDYAEQREFAAPWGGLLLFLTIGMTVLCLAVAIGVGTQAPIPRQIGQSAGLILLAIAAGCALFTVRGYLVAGETLWVRRLFWSTRVSLRGLRSARFDPEATRASIRLWGNGGFFSFSGWYWNKRLGRYRLYATDPKRSVVLEWSERRAVVTPDDPEAFIRRVHRELALVPAGTS